MWASFGPVSKMVGKNKTKQNVLFNELNLKIKMRIAVFERTRAITNNVSWLCIVGAFSSVLF